MRSNSKQCQAMPNNMPPTAKQCRATPRNAMQYEAIPHSASKMSSTAYQFQTVACKSTPNNGMYEARQFPLIGVAPDSFSIRGPWKSRPYT
eukprot:5000382-Pyramimonas_sp.AAC.1